MISIDVNGSISQDNSKLNSLRFSRHIIEDRSARVLLNSAIWTIAAIGKSDTRPSAALNTSHS